MTSKYVQLTSFALLEFRYAKEKYKTSTVGYKRMTNNYTGEYHLLNKDSATTSNTLDNMSFFLGDRKWVYNDIDLPVPYHENDDNLVYEDLTSSIIDIDLTYDVCRIHIQSGYNLENVQGLLFNVKVKDDAGKDLNLTTATLLKNTNILKFNASPMFLQDKVYDRYVDIHIPSVRKMSIDFQASPSSTQTLAYNYTHNNKGFVKDALIRFSLYEIESTQKENGYLTFQTGAVHAVTLNQEDLWSNLSCVLRKSPEGDYFEFYPTWNGEFIQDYLFLLTTSGYDFSVFHEIQVYEQIAGSFILTDNQMRYQETGFDKPQVFRPIIMNSDAAYSFSIDYTMRLLNKVDNTQIIRQASLSYDTPKKYGKKMETITVQNDIQPIRIVNKVERGSPPILPGLKQNVKVQRVYVPSFSQMQTVHVSNVDVTINTAGKLNILSGGADTELILKQGQSRIFFTPFDNYFMFKVLNKITPDDIVPIDFTSHKNVQIVFVDDHGQKIYFDLVRDFSNVTISQGELLFKIPSTKVSKILSFKNKTFYLKSNLGSDEVAFYQGTFDSLENLEKHEKAIEETKAALINSNKNKLTPKVAQPAVTPTVTPASPISPANPNINTTT